jgi:hypothetical protein
MPDAVHALTWTYPPTHTYGQPRADRGQSASFSYIHQQAYRHRNRVSEGHPGNSYTKPAWELHYVWQDSDCRPRYALPAHPEQAKYPSICAG